MAAISVVGEEVTFTLGMRPLRGYIPRSVLMEQLSDRASDHVSLGTVSADAEFDGIGVINAPKEKRLSSLIANLWTTALIGLSPTWITM